MVSKKATQIQLGKAFEFACLDGFANAIKQAGCDIEPIMDEPYQTAESFFSEKLTAARQAKYRIASRTAFAIISPLEPRLTHGTDSIKLFIQPDSAAMGSNGDVRDVVCKRNDWTIGFSCKHNNLAMKHPRITKDFDFGRAWLGIPCSSAFLSRMHSILDNLPETKSDSSQDWNTIDDKFDRYYVPVLESFIEEFRRLTDSNPEVPAKLMRYFIGSQDFYKINFSEKENKVEVIAFNPNGSLNQPAGGNKPTGKVRKLELPSRIFNIEFAEDSRNTIIITFDEGWTISLRIHNKDTKAFRTSLAWDVQLIGYPRSMYNESKFLSATDTETSSLEHVLDGIRQ